MKRVTPNQIARQFAQAHIELTGQLELRVYVYRAEGYRTQDHTFFIKAGTAAQSRTSRYTHPGAGCVSKSHNGYCPHCGGLFLKPVVREAYASEERYGQDMDASEVRALTNWDADRFKPLHKFARYWQTVGCNECIEEKGLHLPHEASGAGHTYGAYRRNPYTFEGDNAAAWYVPALGAFDYERKGGDFYLDTGVGITEAINAWHPGCKYVTRGERLQSAYATFASQH